MNQTRIQRFRWRDGLLRRVACVCWVAAAWDSAAQQPSQGDSPQVLAQPEPTLVLRAGTNLVIEDVTVTSGDGKPVHGLKATDFVLSENGHVQRIRNFAEHELSQIAGRPSLPPQHLAPGLFTNHIEKQTDGPVYVVLLDMLNTPLRDQQYARQQILRFLQQTPTGQQIAIFGLNGRLTLLQAFTSDYSLLRAALSRRSASGVSGFLDDSQGGGGGGNQEANGISEALADTATAPDAQELVANARQFEADSTSFQLGLRAGFTLDALNQIARYLSSIPGRKNLIWFSGSFPVNLLPNTSTENGFTSMSSHEAEFQETMTLLARSQVALYPVDARGLQTTGTFNAASQSTAYNRDATKVGKDIASFDARMATENTTMITAARETGGRAFINTNGLSEAVANVLQIGGNYYTLTYRPEAEGSSIKDAPRHIEVTLPGRNYTLSYRRAYYANISGLAAHSTPSRTTAGKQEATKVTALTPLERSLVRGSPVPTQIQMTVRVRPVTGKEETSLAQSNEPARSREFIGPFLRLAVDYAVDQHDLLFQLIDDHYRTNVEFVIFLYDGNGTLLNRTASTLHANFTPSVYKSFLERPLSFNQDISVPRNPELFLRLAVHDLDSGQTGAIEIPVDAVRRLPPLNSSDTP